LLLLSPPPSSFLAAVGYCRWLAAVTSLSPFLSTRRYTRVTSWVRIPEVEA
jgi:hypothetical protein